VVDCLQQVLEGGKCARTSIVVLVLGFVREGIKPALSGHKGVHARVNAPGKKKKICGARVREYVQVYVCKCACSACVRAGACVCVRACVCAHMYSCNTAHTCTILRSPLMISRPFADF